MIASARRGMDRARLAVTFYARKSVALDAAMLRLPGWSLQEKAALLAGKSRALVTLRKGPAVVTVRDQPFMCRTLVDLGTLQSSLIDVADTVVVPGILNDRDAPVVVDVGANVGQFMAAIAAFFPTATIHSFEPDPASFDCLEHNAQGRARVAVVQCAAGSATTTLPLHRHEFSVMSSLAPGPVHHLDPGNQVEVPVRPLDDLLAEVDGIDLLKVDVEGFEDHVIMGAAMVIARTRFLLIELGLGRRVGESNLTLLATVRRFAPQATIIRFGRPLGEPAAPLCQDVLIDLHPTLTHRTPS